MNQKDKAKRSIGWSTFFVVAATFVVLAVGGWASQMEEPPAETSVNLEAEREALIATDKKWSESVGDVDEFLSYVADDAHFMPFGAPLARGEAIRTTWEGLVSMPGFALEWEATDVEVAESGDLGYTIGAFELTTEQDGASMVTIGKYVTIWSKQDDGSWKVQVDCFNADGPPMAPES